MHGNRGSVYVVPPVVRVGTPGSPRYDQVQIHDLLTPEGVGELSSVPPLPLEKRAPWVLRCGPISTTSQLALMPRPTSRSPMRRSHLRLNPSPCRERGCWHGCERVPYRAGRRYRTKTCLSGSVYRHTSGFAAGPLGVPAQTSSRQTLSPSAQAPARSDLHHVRL